MTNKLYSLSQAFEIIARTRKSERNFSRKPLSNAVIKKLLELTQLAPSSFNLQPYKIIIVRDTSQRSGLSTAMLGGNGNIVNNSPLSLVFLADKFPLRLTKDLIDLEHKNGADPSYLNGLPAKLNFLLGEGWMAAKLKKLGTHLASPLSPAPKLHCNEYWAVKNTIFAAQQLMLAATSLGLSTLPMEGFDERRVHFQLSIPPSTYTIPLIISLGYSADSEEEERFHNSLDFEEAETNHFPQKARYPLDKICYEDSYGQKISFVEKP